MYIHINMYIQSVCMYIYMHNMHSVYTYIYTHVYTLAFSHFKIIQAVTFQCTTYGKTRMMMAIVIKSSTYET